jgi:hypothetical protein
MTQILFIIFAVAVSSAAWALGGPYVGLAVTFVIFASIGIVAHRIAGRNHLRGSVTSLPPVVDVSPIVATPRPLLGSIAKIRDALKGSGAAA